MLALRLHGVTATVAVLAYGALSASPIRIGWARQRNRVLGTLTGVLSIALLATGCGLYYAPSEGSRAIVSSTHWIVGTVMLPPPLVHIWRGGWLRRQHTTNLVAS